MTIISKLICAISFIYLYRTKMFVVSKEPKFVDDYHYPMVADELRNNKFYEALAKAIAPNVSTVLDVGAGTMLLSMMGTKDLTSYLCISVLNNVRILLACMFTYLWK